MVFLAKTITIPLCSKFYHRSGLEGFTCKWCPNEEKRFSSRFFFLQSAHLQTRGLQQQPLHLGRTTKSINFASVLGYSGGDDNRGDDNDYGMVVLKKITFSMMI